MNWARSSSSAPAPAARIISVRQTASGSRVTSAAARSHDSSAARDHSSSACAPPSAAARRRSAAAASPHPQQDLSAVKYRTWSARTCAASCARTARRSSTRSSRTSSELTTTIGRPAPMVVALATGNCVTYSSGTSSRSSVAEDLVVQVPRLGQLRRAEPHRRAEVGGPQRPLVPQLDQLADDLVEAGDGGERRGGRAVGGVLEGPRGDVLELVAVDGKRHAAMVSGTSAGCAAGGTVSRAPSARTRPTAARRQRAAADASHRRTIRARR